MGVTVFDHPLIQHKIGVLRDKNTKPKEFRELLKEISLLMMYEATRGLELEDYEIATPMCKTIGKRVKGEKAVIVPIMRAGLGMVDGLLEVLPTAKIGHMGLYRDHDTLKPVTYFCKMPPNMEERAVYVVDPMLATAGSMIAAIDILIKKFNCPLASIKVLIIIAAPEGIENLLRTYPNIEVFCAQKDSHLDEKSYIIPGLGDAGDRIFGTV